MAKSNSKPVQEVRLGRIKAAIWENEIQNGAVRHNVTFQRIYQDEHGKWDSSDSFGRDDLLLLAKVADLAHDWIFQQGQTNGQPAQEKGERNGKRQAEAVHF
jgi:hypothetical protein